MTCEHEVTVIQIERWVYPTWVNEDGTIVVSDNLVHADRLDIVEQTAACWKCGTIFPLHWSDRAEAYIVGSEPVERGECLITLDRGEWAEEGRVHLKYDGVDFADLAVRGGRIDVMVLPDTSGQYLDGPSSEVTIC